MSRRLYSPNRTDNHAVHTEDGIGRLQVENQLAVPGDGNRYPTDLTKS